MHRLRRYITPALVAFFIATFASFGTAFAAVRGLVVKNNGSVVAQVVDGVAQGELSIPPGQISDPLEIFWLDDNLAEYQPASPPFGVTLVDEDSATVHASPVAPWMFIVTGNNPGESSTTFVLTENGSPVFTSVPVETHCEEEHVEADGFVLRQNGVDLVHVWQGVVTGQLPAHLGQQSPPIEVVFLSPDSIEFIPDEPVFQLVLDIADSSVVTWRPVDQWSFRLTGEAIGQTNVTLKVFHIDHDDFVSPTLTAQTYGSVDVPATSGSVTFALKAPAPNPVRGATRLEFSLSKTGVADLAVFDVHGRRVQQLVNAVLPAGPHAVEWHADQLGAGVYFARLSTSIGTRVSRVVVTR
jgi:hypothetical protein